MIVEQLKAAFGHWTMGRKVEPPNPVEEEFPLEKQEEEAVIIEIEFDDKEEDQDSPNEPINQPETKHKLSIWV